MSDKFCNRLEASDCCKLSDSREVPNLSKGSLFRWKRKTFYKTHNSESQYYEKKQKLDLINQKKNDVNVIDKTDFKINTEVRIINEESTIKKESMDQELILEKEIMNQISSVKKNSINTDLLNIEISNINAEVTEFKSEHNSLPHGMPPVISGIPVKFPKSPYRSQISVMNAVIRGCKNKEHCLLESPTGSGKTLSLLCAALAWQDHYKNTLGYNPIANHEEYKTEKDDRQLELPKIYYGSRTHRQIEQVIREFKKTAYCNKLMTILSSREHTCIQHSRKGVNKTQICNELLDPATKGTCNYYPDNSKNNWGSCIHMDTPWDIEDLVQLGKNENLCPYFTARNLMLTAEIIFCPYNYLLDPSIRETMKINLEGHIVIIDEAHNIEDICREIGGADFREDYIEEAIADCRLVGNLSNEQFYFFLEEYLVCLLTLLQEQQLSVSNNIYEEISSSCWTGSEAWMLFKMRKLGADKYLQFKQFANVAIANYSEVRETLSRNHNRRMNLKKPSINYITKNLLEKFLNALECIKNSQHSEDYRCIITESYCNDAKVKVDQNVWVTGQGSKRLRTMKFMCMNPAVIFSQLNSKVRSIILASGTLSPTSTFESELGTKFSHKLHASHVITKDQVYVRSIARGPQGTVLKATYNNVHTLPFKDDLGRLLVDVCQAVPHGILCFFSSYSMMTSQIERWQETTVWEDIQNCKVIVKEPRSNNDLVEVMHEFRRAIQATEGQPYCSINGALLLAVYRGKVAEGIDFCDNEARCVITVGIPYAVQSDPVVKLKRHYNDLHRHKGLLSGGDWYSIQAYRALNQALGRCIRHKNDWGAILMVDERLLSSCNNNYLPKWIKDIRLEDQDYNLKEELKSFVKRQKTT